MPCDATESLWYHILFSRGSPNDTTSTMSTPPSARSSCESSIKVRMMFLPFAFKEDGLDEFNGSFLEEVKYGLYRNSWSLIRNNITMFVIALIQHVKYESMCDSENIRCA